MAYGTSADNENTLGLSTHKAAPNTATPVAAATPAVPSASVVPATSEVPNSGWELVNGERASKCSTFARSTWENCQPWGEFFSTRALSKPTFAGLSDRVKKNLMVFQSNYIVVCAVWLSLFVLSSIPMFLIVVLVLLLLDRMATKRAIKRGGSLTPEDYLFFATLVLLLMWVTGIYHSVTSALICSIVTCSAHASLYAPNEPFLPPPAVANIRTKGESAGLPTVGFA